MQTTQSSFLDFLGMPDTQFTIPVYQRVYSWTKTQCEELAEDIMRAGVAGTSHFLSMTLYMENAEEDAAGACGAGASTCAGSTQAAQGIKHLDIIDGQQRIATTTIMLTALRDHLVKTGETVINTHENAAFLNETLSAKDIHNKFLVASAVAFDVAPAATPDAASDVAPDAAPDAASAAAPDAAHGVQAKVRLIGPDKDTLNSLVFQTAAPERPSRRVQENYEYFASFFAAEDFDANTFWSGVCELLIISAKIDEADKAQTIFEGLNTKGIPLTAADLMRNYLLVAQTREEQQRLYQEYWQPMEIMFEDDILSSGSLKLNTGLRMWLAIRFKRMCISDKSRTYYYFKRYMETEYDGTVEELLDELRSFCYMWAENYKFNEGRNHCSRFAWAKKGRPLTIAERQVAAGMKAQAKRAIEAAYNKEAHRSSSMAGNEMTSLLPNFHRGMI